MELRIERPGANLDVPALLQELLALDASAVLDRETASGALRIATLLPTAHVLQALQALQAHGLALRAEDLLPLPSVCCGGCSG
jgi:hypothetical protein